MIFFFKATATTEISPYCHTLSRHDALPISDLCRDGLARAARFAAADAAMTAPAAYGLRHQRVGEIIVGGNGRRAVHEHLNLPAMATGDRKSTRLNSSH